jgi:hypothetical protein
MSQRISKAKLEKEFARVNTLDLDYVKKAKEIAKRLSAGEEVAQCEIAEVRLGAVNDRNNLKGDFVISCYMDMYDTFNRWTKGKSLNADDNLIKSIYRNGHPLTVKAKENVPVRKFCEIAGISLAKYYRIANQDVKNPETIERLAALKEQVERELHN